MTKIKVPKHSPSLDMTPMVDLAFLLVTFFMLTATSRVSEPVIVDTPSSISEKLLPKNVILISVDKDGKPFYNINNSSVRVKVLERMGQKYEIEFTDQEKKRFAGMASFGVPMAQLKEYLALDNAEQTNVKSPGIPSDSTHHELADWIQFGRIEAAKLAKSEKEKAERLGRSFDYEPLRFAIKADSDASYFAVKDIITVFTDQDIYRFNLITNLEQGDEEP